MINHNYTVLYISIDNQNQEVIYKIILNNLSKFAGVLLLRYVFPTVFKNIFLRIIFLVIVLANNQFPVNIFDSDVLISDLFLSWNASLIVTNYRS